MGLVQLNILQNGKRQISKQRYGQLSILYVITMGVLYLFLLANNY